MIERFGRGHLPALRHPGSYLVTFFAGNLQMLCVIETDAE
jgi:hypothetical protein